MVCTSAASLSLQVSAILALEFVWFGTILPSLWVDKGFPAILALANAKQARLDAFEDIASGDFGNYPRVALAAAAVHTAGVVAGVVGGTTIKKLFCAQAKSSCSSGKMLARVVCACVLTAAVFGAMWCLFTHSFDSGWTWGFDYGYHFFEREAAGAASTFGRIAASSITLQFGIALGTRLCTQKYQGLFPSFAHSLVSRALTIFVGSYALFRYAATPAVVQAAMVRVANFIGFSNTRDDFFGPPSSTDGNASNISVNDWALAAACIHTLCLTMGMGCAFITRDIVMSSWFSSSACRTSAHTLVSFSIRFMLVGVLAAAFFSLVQGCLYLADVHGLEFFHNATYGLYSFGDTFKSLKVSKESRAAFTDTTGTGSSNVPACIQESADNSYRASVLGAGAFTAWFVLGSAFVDGPDAVAGVLEPCRAGSARRISSFASRNLRLRPAPSFRPSKKSSSNSGNSGYLTSAALVLAAVAAILYSCNDNLLSASLLHKVQTAKETMGAWRQLGPSAWAYMTDNFTRNELYFLTLPVLLLSEVPLWFFTVLDVLKLRWADRYRIHYSKIDTTRPRLYPTSAELGKAFRVHVVNFFGLYCTVFVVGVGLSILTGIVPYSFSPELPSLGRWIAEFMFCSFVADVLFYVIHRAVHSKGLYHLHKMHHEWVYTIALSHHYKEPFEAAIFMLPPVLPPILLGSHITIVWAIVLVTQLGGILGHSAFMIPIISNKYTTWIPFLNSWYHDLHHLRFNVNYGAVWPFVDMLFGTYREEPIVYINGVEAATLEDEEVLADNDNNKAHDGAGSRQQGESAPLVAESAEDASFEGALPALPWYMRWLSTKPANFVSGK